MVGSQGNLVHFDGQEWSNMGFYTTVHLRRVWGTAPDNVYAVGDSGLIMRYDGNEWSFLNSNTAKDLYGIWGDSKDNIFAVGAFGTILHYGEVAQPPPTAGPTLPGNQPPQATTPSTEVVPEPTDVNWLMIWGACGAALVAGAAVGFSWVRRRSKKATPPSLR